MPKTAPPGAENSTILFYPTDSSQIPGAIAPVIGILAIPIMLLLAFAAPLIVLIYPLFMIACWLNKVPFSWDLEECSRRLESSSHTTSKQ